MGESKGSKLLCCPGGDRISQLPDNIIDNILIRLPIADAARTAVLSRKWKHGWISISKLEFGLLFAFKSKKVGYPNSIMAIYGILMLHLGPIARFKLSITCVERISEIDRIFHFLSRKGVQELDVCIFLEESDNSACYILPSHFYSCLQLRCLGIGHCTINPPSNFGGFRNLNSLKLEYLELTNSVFENFISKCPLIEDLKINFCHLLESPFFMINALNLKHFYFNGTGSCFRFISAPRLKSLKHVDSKPGEDWGRQSDYGVEKSSLEEFCNALPALESLKVDHYFLQNLEVRNMSSQCGRCLKWLHRLKSLQAYCLRLYNKDEVTSLLGLIGSSPNLNVLDIEMEDLPYNMDGRDNPFNSLEPNHLDFWCENLQVVRLSRVRDHDHGLDFIKLLLLKSPTLEKMYIETYFQLNPFVLLRIFEKVNQFRRALAAAEVVFSY